MVDTRRLIYVEVKVGDEKKTFSFKSYMHFFTPNEDGKQRTRKVQHFTN